MSDILTVDCPISIEGTVFPKLATQFRSSVTLINYIKALLSEAQDLETVFCQIYNLRNIDEATGQTLTILGILVGQPRTLVTDDDTPYFAWDEYPFIEKWDEGNWAEGNVLGVQTVTLTDDELRLFIRARILKNKSKATIDEIIEIVKIILQDDPEVLITESHMSFTIGINRPLTGDELGFLRYSGLVPKPAGVEITNIYSY